MHSVNFKISYHNGDAAQGRLDMYDAAVSLHGFAKALSITTHALLNEGEVRRKGNSIKGAQIYIRPSRKGSFQELITIAIQNDAALAIGSSIVGTVFYDLLKWTWSKTVEKEYQPSTPHVQRLNDRIEPFIGDIEEALEVPLKQAHRPIEKADNMVVVIKRPRAGEVFRIDNETLKTVSVQTEPNVIRDVTGNVTRYNILSGIGRFYDDALEHTVSFKMPESSTRYQSSLITWSLHNAVDEGEGKINLSVKRVVSAKGSVRRYLVQSVSEISGSGGNE